MGVGGGRGHPNWGWQGWAVCAASPGSGPWRRRAVCRGAEPEEQWFLDESPTITACPIALSDINRDFLEGGQILGQGKKNTGRGEKEEKSFRILIQQ